MSNRYIPLSTETTMADVYEFTDQVTSENDFRAYFEALAEMAQRRRPANSVHECQEIAFESLRRGTLNSDNVTPDAREWIEALRPKGYTSRYD